MPETIPNWQWQNGIVFISPERLALFFVRDDETPGIGTRGESGGTGRFELVVRILRSIDGATEKEMRFTTNSENSGVLYGKDGRFFVRAGEVIYVFDESLNQIGKIDLPLNRVATHEDWAAQTSPSGGRLWIVHRQSNGFGSTMQPESELKMLDSRTLRVIQESRCGNARINGRTGGPLKRQR